MKFSIILESICLNYHIISGSLSLPFTALVKPDDVTTFRSKKEIRDAFVEAGVIFGAKTVLTCGSGVSAAVLGFGLHLMGKL